VPLDPVFRFYDELSTTVKVICFPKVPFGDMVDFLEEAQGALGAFDCVLKMSMTYEQVSPGPAESH